jgi:hypothetical protein
MGPTAGEFAMIHDLERRRCQAVVLRDTAALDSLLAEEMIHTHGTGLAEHKAAYLRGILSRVECKSSERSNLCIRFYGPVAISTGNVTNVVRPLGSEQEWETVHAMATIVWAKQDGVWKLVSFHASKIAAALA